MFSSVPFAHATHAAERHNQNTVRRCDGTVGQEEGIMGMIMIRCPATGRAASTGIEMLAVDQLPIVTGTMSCPACGRIHEWTKNDAWLGDGSEQYRLPRIKPRSKGQG